MSFCSGGLDGEAEEFPGASKLKEPAVGTAEGRGARLQALGGAPSHHSYFIYFIYTPRCDVAVTGSAASPTALEESLGKFAHPEGTFKNGG